MRETKFTFKNNGGEINNDVVYPGQALELTNNSYSFTIQPKTRFWRFGIRLSKTESIEFFHPENRYKEPEFKKYKDIHLGVGEWEGFNWTIPDRVHLAQYNFLDLDHILNYSTPYAELGKIEWTIQYLPYIDSLYVSYRAEGCKIFSNTYLLDKEFKYFKIVAWADKIDFELDVNVSVVDLDESNINAFKIDNIVFRKGDIMDYDVLKNTNVIVFPISTNGTVTPNIRNRMFELGAPFPPKKAAGEIHQFQLLNNNNNLSVVYAYSVDNYRSSTEIISKICYNLQNLIFKQVITGLNIPLLGTGAGNLSVEEVVFMYNSIFNTNKLRFNIIVSVLNAEDFGRIRNLFRKQYVPYKEEKFDKPELIKSLEKYLAINIADHEFTIDQNDNLIRLCLTNVEAEDLSILVNFIHLKSLQLISCKIQDYWDLSRLKNLTTLLINACVIKNYSVFNDLTQIQMLEITFCNLNNIDFLSHLKELRNLNLTGNKIKDIKPLVELYKLESLILSDNNISDISKLGIYPKLKSLFFRNNRIENIDSLVTFKELSSLDVSHNNINDFSILLELKDLDYLQADNNPFFKQRDIRLDDFDNHLPPIKNYLLRQAESSKEELILPAKVLLLGNHASGKSSLLKYLQDGKLVKKIKSTHIIKIEKYPLTSKNIPKAIFFDFGGQDYYHGIYRAFLSGGSIYIILWNKDQNDNLQRKDTDGIFTQDFTMNYWLCQKIYLENEVYGSGTDPVLLVQSHSDEHSKASSFDSNSEHEVLNEFYVSFLKSSTIKRGISKYEVNQYALKYLKASILDLIENKRIVKQEPKWYIDFLAYIMTENSTGTSKGKSLSKEVIKFYKRDSSNNIDFLKDDLDQLHKQGLVLYYRDSLPDIVWLNPVALVEYVHNTILNKKGVGKSPGQVLVSEFEKIDENIIQFLSLQKVIFEHNYGENGKEYIIPNYLPLANDSKSDFSLLTFDLNNLLFCLKFKDFLPFGIINQIICFFGRLPDSKKFWRDQLLFTFQSKAKILINLDFIKLEIKAYGSFISKINSQEKDNIKRYLFYGIMSLYWNFDPLPFELFTGFINKSIKKEDYLLDDLNFQKLANTEKIFEKEECRPLDLFISLDDKYFVNYFDLCKAEESLAINSFQVQGNRTLEKEPKVIPIFPFNIFTNKTFTKMKKIFISYSKLDLPYVNKFIDHLSSLKYDGKVATWYCTELMAGSEWDLEIQQQFDESDIVCFMISPNFMKTKYIREFEIKKAFERKNSDPSFLVVPIILDFCRWQTTTENLSAYTALPYTAKPVADFNNQNMAWYIIEEGLRLIIDKNMQPMDDDWVAKNLPEDVKKIFERIVLGKVDA